MGDVAMLIISLQVGDC